MTDPTPPEATAADDDRAPAPPAPAGEGAASAAETTTTPPVIPTVNLRDMPPSQPDEIGGPRGPEPTRYGDWERKGRVSDF